MFEASGTSQLLEAADGALRSVTLSLPEQARVLKSARDALDAELALVLAQMDATFAHEAEGASSITTWADRELRLDRAVTRQMVRADETFRLLPQVGSAATEGRLTMDHVRTFTYVIAHMDREFAIEWEQTLLEVALTNTPAGFHAHVRELRDLLASEELDRRWLRDMAKYDVKVVRVGDGFQIVGYLPPDLGAKVKVLLESLSIPRQEGDDRTSAERRLHGLTDLVDGILQHGLPQDAGVRPHVHLIMDEDGPSHLEGFGPIGSKLAAMIACDSELTPYLSDKRGDIHEVGRTQRTATLGQKKAIRLRQGGRCGTPGCGHHIRHFHHVEWWSRGGLTEIQIMVGLCHKCHILVHQEQLFIHGTFAEGFRYSTHRNGALPRAG